MNDRFAHQLRLDQIRDGERLDLVADDGERRAIAERLGLAALDRLEAHATLSRTGQIVRAEGGSPPRSSRAASSPASPSPPMSTSRSRCCSCPSRRKPTPEDEIELGEEDCDVVFYDGAAIDLGGAIADTLALSLDPYPRSAGADAALKEAGVLQRRASEAPSRCSRKAEEERLLERNVVVEVGVERRRLRTRLGAGAARRRRNRRSPKSSLNAAAAAPRRLRGYRAAPARRGSSAARLRSYSGRCRTGPAICGSGAGLRDRPSSPCADSSWRRAPRFSLKITTLCHSVRSWRLPSRSFQLSDVATRMLTTSPPF